jgi:hypothetical protein
VNMTIYVVPQSQLVPLSLKCRPIMFFNNSEIGNYLDRCHNFIALKADNLLICFENRPSGIHLMEIDPFLGDITKEKPFTFDSIYDSGDTLLLIGNTQANNDMQNIILNMTDFSTLCSFNLTLGEIKHVNYMMTEEGLVYLAYEDTNSMFGILTVDCISGNYSVWNFNNQNQLINFNFYEVNGDIYVFTMDSIGYFALLDLRGNVLSTYNLGGNASIENYFQLNRTAFMIQDECYLSFYSFVNTTTIQLIQVFDYEYGSCTITFFGSSFLIKSEECYLSFNKGTLALENIYTNDFILPLNNGSIIYIGFRCLWIKDPSSPTISQVQMPGKYFSFSYYTNPPYTLFFYLFTAQDGKSSYIAIVDIIESTVSWYTVEVWDISIKSVLPVELDGEIFYLILFMQNKRYADCIFWDTNRGILAVTDCFDELFIFMEIMERNNTSAQINVTASYGIFKYNESLYGVYNDSKIIFVDIWENQPVQTIPYFGKDRSDLETCKYNFIPSNSNDTSFVVDAIVIDCKLNYISSISILTSGGYIYQIPGNNSLDTQIFPNMTIQTCIAQNQSGHIFHPPAICQSFGLNNKFYSCPSSDESCVMAINGSTTPLKCSLGYSFTSEGQCVYNCPPQTLPSPSGVCTDVTSVCSFVCDVTYLCKIGYFPSECEKTTAFIYLMICFSIVTSVFKFFIMRNSLHTRILNLLLYHHSITDLCLCSLIVIFFDPALIEGVTYLSIIVFYGNFLGCLFTIEIFIFGYLSMAGEVKWIYLNINKIISATYIVGLLLVALDYYIVHIFKQSPYILLALGGALVVVIDLLMLIRIKKLYQNADTLHYIVFPTILAFTWGFSSFSLVSSLVSSSSYWILFTASLMGYSQPLLNGLLYSKIILGNLRVHNSSLLEKTVSSEQEFGSRIERSRIHQSTDYHVMDSV